MTYDHRQCFKTFCTLVEYKVSSTFSFILVIFVLYEACQPDCITLSKEKVQRWYTEQVKSQAVNIGEQR